MGINNAAIQFCKRLIGAFSQYPVPAETKEIYERQLVKWKLSPVEWDRTLDYLIENHVKLPTLNEIIDTLKRHLAGNRAQKDTSLGWMHFDSGRYHYVIRVKADKGKWVGASVQYKGPNGVMIELGRDIGLPPNLPADAINCRVYPDSPAHEDFEQIAGRTA